MPSSLLREPCQNEKATPSRYRCAAPGNRDGARSRRRNRRVARGKTVRPTTSPIEAHVLGVLVRGAGLDRATNAAPRRNQIVGSNEPRNNENAADAI